MALDCKICRKHIDFSGDQPLFCPYCGVSLSSNPSAKPRSTEVTTPYVQCETEGTIDHTPEETRTSVDAPERIGGYRLIRFLGAGGMGAVYEGVAEDSGQRVAVKLLLTKGNSDAVTLDRFRQEGRLASLLAHPNCVFVLRADEEAGRPYIVMELMSGETVRDEVKRRGPLPPNEAISKTLDILDGLIEAHRLNILHRDVKPSNCFLVSGGRVKVGDFGLSKSLATDTNLTQTGAFLGTVLYAAPEQIRGDPLGFTADVYSACATLYFMLTGRAPFQNDNPAIVIAQALSESPPDVKQLRPEVSAQLQKIVMRGLERDRERRWQSLDDLRKALLESSNRKLDRGGLGSRFVAHVIDTIALTPFWALGTLLEHRWHVPQWPFWFLPALTYYTVLESRFGGSLGKLALRLQVCDAKSGERLVLGQAFRRTLVFLFLSQFLLMCAELFYGQAVESHAAVNSIVELIGFIAPLITMRRSNGYRGPHELFSGTRVIQLPWPRPIRRLQTVEGWKPELMPLDQFPEVPRTIEAYHPRGVLSHCDGALAMLVEDPALGRDVQLLLRKRDTPGPSEVRRSIARQSRLRWLTSGTNGDWVWDAFLAPSGHPLPVVSRPGRTLDWPQTQAILEQLTEELCEAKEDGSLQEPIDAEQIWIRSDGRTQIQDVCVRKEASHGTHTRSELELLRDVAQISLEGNLPDRAWPRSIRAPLPAYASQLLDRLVGVGRSFESVQEFRGALSDVHGRPAETTSYLRLTHIGIQSLLLAPLLGLMLAFAGIFNGLFMAGLKNELTTLKSDVGSDAVQLKRDSRERPNSGADVTHKKAAIEQHMDRVRPGLNAAERLIVRFSPVLDGPDEPSDQPADRRKPRVNVQRTEAAPFNTSNPNHLQDEVWGYALAYCLFVLAVVVVWVVWAFITRGGLTLQLAGLAIVRPDGRPASRSMASVRAQLVWAPFAALLCLCVIIKVWAPRWLLLHNAIWWAAAGYLVAAVIIAYRRPSQGPHERMAGLIVVPR